MPPDDEGVIDFDSFSYPEPDDPCLEEVVKHLPASEFGFGPRWALEWLYWPTIREHLKIVRKPKRLRGRGRPKGSRTMTSNQATTREAVKLWEQGYYSDLAIYNKLKPAHEFDGGRRRRAKIATLSPGEQARISEAHKAGKARMKAERALKLTAKKNNPEPNFLLY